MTLNSMGFNQDASCLAVGADNGYRIYNCSPFGQFLNVGSGAIGEARMLFSTSLVVLVGHGDDPAFSPRRLKVVNTKRELTICELTFPTAILRVLMNRHRLVVVLEHQLYIYNISTMKLLHTIETIPNPQGVADLTPGSEAGVLVYPSGPLRHSVVAAGQASGQAPPSAGELTIFDCSQLSPINVIKAHKSPLAVMSLNSDGTLLATVSDRGTILRIFSIPAGTLLHEFRRGSYTSNVHSIAFNLSSSIVALSSSTQTVHIYKLGTKTELMASSSAGVNALAQSSTAEDGEDSPETVTSSSEVSSPPNAPSATSAAPGSADSDDSLAIDALVETKRKGYKASFKRKVSRARDMLPSAMADILEPKSRDFAYFKLPSAPGVHSVIGLAPLSTLIYVATSDGTFYHYSLPDQGGECKRVAAYAIT